jgi:membrane protein DedA with SNARE-associated domain
LYEVKYPIGLEIVYHGDGKHRFPGSKDNSQLGGILFRISRFPNDFLTTSLNRRDTLGCMETCKSRSSNLEDGKRTQQMRFGEGSMLFDLVLPTSLKVLPYLFLGLFAMVEGPFAILTGGAAAASGLMLPLPVYLAVVTGNLVADMGWYIMGRFSKPQWLVKVSSRMGVDPRRLKDLEQGIQRYAPRLLFFSKLTVGLPIPTLVATGMNRIPMRRWAAMLILGELIKSAALLGVGYLYARVIQQALSGVQAVLWGITAVVLVACVVWFKLRRRECSRC